MNIEEVLGLDIEYPIPIPTTLRCPKCGHKYERPAHAYYMTAFEAILGNRCTKCFQEWLNQNIPEMEIVSEKGASDG